MVSIAPSVTLVSAASRLRGSHVPMVSIAPSVTLVLTSPPVLCYCNTGNSLNDITKYGSRAHVSRNIGNAGNLLNRRFAATLRFNNRMHPGSPLNDCNVRPRSREAAERLPLSLYYFRNIKFNSMMVPLRGFAASRLARSHGFHRSKRHTRFNEPPVNGLRGSHVPIVSPSLEYPMPNTVDLGFDHSGWWLIRLFVLIVFLINDTTLIDATCALTISWATYSKLLD